MLEAAYIIGWVAAILVLLAFALRANRKRLLARRSNGSTTPMAVSESTSQLLMWGLGLSALAAVFAIAGRMFG